MRKTITFIFLLICLSLSVNAASESSETTPVPGQVNPYKTCSELLTDVMAYTGIFTPGQAADVWAGVGNAQFRYAIHRDY